MTIVYRDVRGHGAWLGAKWVPEYKGYRQPQGRYPCHMSISKFPIMSPVLYTLHINKIPLACISYRNSPTLCPNIPRSFMIFNSSMSIVEFKKWPCRPVGFKGLHPTQSTVRTRSMCTDWVLEDYLFCLYFCLFLHFFVTLVC